MIILEVSSSPVFGVKTGKDGLKLASKHLRMLHDFLKRHGVKLTLVVYPWPDQIYYQDKNSLQVTYWEEWTKARGVCFINLFPPFFRNPDKYKTLDDYYIRNDVHWSKAGHKLVADYFVEQFHPQIAPTKTRYRQRIHSRGVSNPLPSQSCPKES